MPQGKKEKKQLNHDKLLEQAIQVPMNQSQATHFQILALERYEQLCEYPSELESSNW